MAETEDRITKAVTRLTDLAPVKWYLSRAARRGHGAAAESLRAGVSKAADKESLPANEGTNVYVCVAAAAIREPQTERASGQNAELEDGHLTLDWPGRPASLSPVGGLVHPTTAAPPHPLRVFKVKPADVPMQTELINGVGAFLWANQWDVAGEMPERELYGPHADAVMAALDNLTEQIDAPMPVIEEQMQRLHEQFDGVTSSFIGGHMQRTVQMRQTLLRSAEEGAGVGALAAQSVARSTSGFQGAPTQLLDAAVTWVAVRGDDPNPLAPVLTLVAAGFLPFIDDSDEIQLLHISREDRQLANAAGQRNVPAARAGNTAAGGDLTTLTATALNSIEDRIGEHIIGQRDAIHSVARMVRNRAARRHGQPKSPISFVSLGPSGVGKTALGIALAQVIYGDPKRVVKIDMSEYMESHESSRLKGAPPGYVGYDAGSQLANALQPFTGEDGVARCVLIFDEIDKAHPNNLNLFLQILEDGKLTDGQGKVIDLSGCIVEMTANFGSSTLKPHRIGFAMPEKPVVTGSQSRRVQANWKRIDPDLKGQLKDAFEKGVPPEIRRRFKEFAYFHTLGADELAEIAAIKLAQVAEEFGVEITATPAALKIIAAHDHDPTAGASNLDRALNALVEPPIADAINNGSPVTKFAVTVDHGRIRVRPDRHLSVLQTPPDNHVGLAS